ncbi:SidA/IucD/PvdA family monooxygenase [Actinosynnema sp. NPDC023794]
MLDHQDVELLAIGAGPANLALAVALEELSPDLAARALVVEQHDDIVWQRGMLLPWSRSQVSFLKDLVTLRNPTSPYSFVNYLHSTGRLDEFINLGTFTPYRLEISGYLAWVARSLTKVRLQHGRRAVAVEPQHGEAGSVDRWLVRFADGSTVSCATLVIGVGRDPHLPTEFAALPRERVVHSTEFVTRIGALDPEGEHRIVVVGGAQSAAEMLWSAHETFPRAKVTMVMRSIGLNGYESSKFTNELFYPSFVDKFNEAQPDARTQLLREMHRTNYAGLSPAMLDNLYHTMYLEKLTGTQRLSMVTMAEVVDSALVDDEVVLTLLDRRTGERSELRCDRVMLGTGFDKRMPTLVRSMAAEVGQEDFTVTRNYRLQLPEAVSARVYLQGVNEATHGIADSLISVLAIRAAEIVADLADADEDSVPVVPQRVTELFAEAPQPA